MKNFLHKLKLPIALLLLLLPNLVLACDMPLPQNWEPTYSVQCLAVVAPTYDDQNFKDTVFTILSVGACKNGTILPNTGGV